MLKQFTLLAVACTVAGAAQAALPVYGFVVKNIYPHDPQAFTQGLFYRDGHLYESTGQVGRSTIRKVELKTGKVLQKADLPSDIFGEGSTAFGNNLIGLTWTSQVGYVFDLKTFKLKQSFKYEGEGWGLASDDRQLYMSDGSAYIRILDAKTMQELKRVQVTAEGRPVDRLNELEMVDGQLYSNIWGTDYIARIDPESGKVVGVIDLSGLLPPDQRGTREIDAVLNGIAWDSKGKRLFVTGKLWPKLFEIELVPKLRK